jgi:hypothetical protein
MINSAIPNNSHCQMIEIKTLWVNLTIKYKGSILNKKIIEVGQYLANIDFKRIDQIQLTARTDHLEIILQDKNHRILKVQWDRVLSQRHEKNQFRICQVLRYSMVTKKHQSCS